MDALIALIFWGVIISKIVKSAKKNDKKKQRLESQQRPMQQRPVQRTTQAQRDAYYYAQQKNTKERLQQKYNVQHKTVSQSDIISRAKENVKENEPDKMQRELHEEVCRGYKETVHIAPDVKIHKASSDMCDTAEESDIIKKVNDLMIVGYSGDLEFDRDFIAEGIEMLNHFTI